MKTPMNELIEMMEDAKAKNLTPDWVSIIRAYGLVRKEKNAIINAVNFNEQKAVNYCNDIVFKHYGTYKFFDIDENVGERYFNETYNQNN
jgi:hypothetical protein